MGHDTVTRLPSSRGLSFRGGALCLFRNGASLVGQELAQELQPVCHRRRGPAHRHRLGPVPEVGEQPADGAGVEPLGCQELLELPKVAGDGLEAGVAGGFELFPSTLHLRDRPLDRESPDALVQRRRRGVYVFARYPVLRHAPTVLF